MPQGTFARLAAQLSIAVAPSPRCSSGSLACFLPAPASAQWDTMLKTFMQNVAPPSSQPPPSYYPPPAYYGQPRPTYSAPPSGAYQQYPPPPPAYYGQPRPVVPTAADRQRAAEMQRMLDDLGYDAGPASGSWGERSREALRGFLRDHGQPASGEVTPVSQAAVRSAWHERGQAVMPSMPAAANGAPSFDCRRAAAPAEIAICRDPGLAGLDRELAEAFQQAQAAAASGDTADLSAQQRAWMRRRDACGTNVLCLRQTMAGRVAELRQMPQATESATAVPTADTPLATAPAGAAAAQAAQQDATQGGDPLEALVHPPAGLRPWSFETWDGRPAVTYLAHRPGRDDRPDVDVANDLFHLLAAGTLPGYLDDPANVASVRGFLSDDAAKMLFGGGAGGSTMDGWTGANEFEASRSRQAFYSKYVPLLKAVAPKPPFELRWIEPAIIEPYDATRGGFQVQPLFRSSLPSSNPLQVLRLIKDAGFNPTPGFTAPDLFWPTDAATAEAALRRVPDRRGELAAVIEVASVDPDAKEIMLQLRRLSLYAPNRSAKLYDFPLGPEGAATAGSAQGSDQPSVIPAPAAAPGADPASSNGADAARRWDLPTLRGLPLLAPDLQGANLDSYGRNNTVEFGLLPAGKIPPYELWTRAIEALTLAVTPDPARAYSDSDMAGFACFFLPKTTRMQMFQQDSCHFQPFLTGAEFALKDGAAAFRARELPKIIAAAPRLPLRMLLVLKIEAEHYDSQRAGFPLKDLLPGHSEPPWLFRSKLDVSLPDFWPASEADARTFLASQTLPFASFAWLALNVSIVGTMPSQGSWPIGAWRFRTEDMALYADPGLRRPLYRFAKPLRLPQPILDTQEEQAPRPLGPMPLSGEAALLALHNTSVPAGLQLDWWVAAAERARFEDTFRDRPDWQDFDPWGVFFPRGADLTDPSKPDAKAKAERYRAWSARRSAVLPKTFTFWRQLQGQGADGSPQTIAVLGDDWRHVGPFDNNPSYNAPSPDLARQLQSRGIETSQMLPIQMLFPGNQFISVYAAVPQPRQNYTVTIGDTGATASQQGGAPARLVIQSELAGVDVLPNGGNGNAFAIVLRLVPKTVELRNGTAVVSTMALPDVGWTAVAPPPRLLSPAEQLAAGPYGPDMVGLRLGMTTQEAEAAIRGEMQVGQVLETPEPAAGQEKPPAWLHGRLFIAKDGKERIAIFEGRGPAAGRVAGVWRQMLVKRSNELQNQVIAAMQAKYGPPSVRGSETAWSARPATEMQCWNGSFAAWENWTENDSKPFHVGYAASNEAPELVVPYTDEGSRRLSYSQCGPSLHVKVGNGGPGFASSVTEIPVYVFLQDMGIMAWLAAQPGAVPPPPPPPPMKF